MAFSKSAPFAKAMLAAVAAFGLSQPAFAEEPAEEIVFIDIGIDPVAMELASQIVDLGYPEATREALFFDTMDQMMVQMRIALEPTLPDDDEGAVAIVDEWIAEHMADSKEVLRKHIPAIMQGMAESYANIFSVEELTDILTFVQTSSGKRYFEQSPKILSDKAFADANQAYMDETMALVSPATEQLMIRLKEYLEDAEANEAGPEA